MEHVFKTITLVLFVSWVLYWRYAWIKTEKEKPQNKTQFSLKSYQTMSKSLLYCMYVILFFQLAGLVIFPFPGMIFVQILGLLLVVLGFILSVVARIELGNNWSPCYDYQVKKQQELIVRGIYRYIRHPIYTGILLVFMGGELVVSSYLFFIATLFIVGAYFQGKKEEALLESHFGKEYAEYKKKTKMLIPFVW